MRLAFTGSHSTGKTTLLDYIERNSENGTIKTIKGITRAIISRGFPMGPNSTIDSYVNYIRDQLSMERQISTGGFDLLISDRTVLDAYAYAIVNRSLPRPYIPDYFIDMLKEVWLREASFYDLYVYFPIEFALVEDGIRPTDTSYRGAVDEVIRKTLEEHEVRFVTVQGCVHDRYNILRDSGVSLLALTNPGNPQKT